MVVDFRQLNKAHVHHNADDTPHIVLVNSIIGPSRMPQLTRFEDVVAEWWGLVVGNFALTVVVVIIRLRAKCDTDRQ